ncbi:MAG: tetratricopeptide repeat protein [Thermoanaerobaculia bacterium]
MRRKRHRLSTILLLIALAVLTAAPAVAAEPSTAAAEVAFTYGVRAYNHGDFAEAVRLFQEAVAADPDNREAREWLAAAQRRQSGSAVTVPGFAGLLPLRDQPRFDLRAGAAYGQDSNPAQLSSDTVLVASGGRVLKGEVDDRVTDLNLRAAAYPFYGLGSGDPRSGWSLGLTGQVKAARFQDLDFLNERQWSAAVQLAWGSDPLGYLTGPLGYTRVPFGHSRFSLLLQAGRTDSRVNGDPQLTADEAALTLVVREAVITATQVELDFQRRDYVDGLSKPDAWSVGAGQLLFLGRRDRYLRLGASRGKENDGLRFDTTSLEGTAELALPLTDRLVVQLAGSRRKDSSETTFFPGISLKFDTTTTRAAAALSWELARHFYVAGRASWSERTPGSLFILSPQLIAFDKYQRTVASVGIQWIW